MMWFAQNGKAEKAVYIGKTLFGGKQFNKIEPIAVAGKSGWEIITDRLATFPSEGKVFTFDTSLAGREGIIALFTVTENKPDRDDRYITEEVMFPYEVVWNFETFSVDDQRLIATREGIEIGDQPASRLVLPLGVGQCAFPHVRMDGETKKYVLSPTEDLSKINVYEADLENIGGSLSIDGRYFVIPGREPTRLIGVINWESDQDCIDHILRKLKKLDELSPGSELDGISKQVIRRLLAAYSRGELLEADGYETAALGPRLGLIVHKLENGIGAIKEIADTLLHLPAVQNELNSRVEEEKRSKLTEIESQIRFEVEAKASREIFDLRAEIDQLQIRKEELTKNKSRLENELADLASIKDGRLHDARKSVEDIVRRISDTSKDFREVLRFASLPACEQKSSNQIVDAFVTAASPLDEEAETLALHDLRQKLDFIADQFLLEKSQLMQVDIAVRSGEIPFLFGDAAETYLDCYAKAVSGGRLHRMILDPNVLGIEDLWLSPNGRAQTALCVAWKLALEVPETLQLVCLDGVDAATLTNWFPQFRRHFRRNRPHNLFVAAIRQGNATEVEGDDVSLRVDLSASLNLVLGFLKNGFLQYSVVSRLKAPFTSELSEADFRLLIGACHDRQQLTINQAGALRSLACAAKAWGDLTPELIKIPLSLLEKQRL